MWSRSRSPSTTTALEDLRARLRATRWPGAAPGAPWSQGTDRAYLQDLCAYWADDFDWRARETALNALEHFLADVDGVRVHFVHVRRGGTPLILTPRLAERLRRVPAARGPPRTASIS